MHVVSVLLVSLRCALFGPSIVLSTWRWWVSYWFTTSNLSREKPRHGPVEQFDIEHISPLAQKCN